MRVRWSFTALVRSPNPLSRSRGVISRSGRGGEKIRGEENEEGKRGKRTRKRTDRCLPVEGPVRLLYPLLHSILRRLDRFGPQMPCGLWDRVSEEQVCCRPARHRPTATTRQTTASWTTLTLIRDVCRPLILPQLCPLRCCTHHTRLRPHCVLSFVVQQNVQQVNNESTTNRLSIKARSHRVRCGAVRHAADIRVCANRWLGYIPREQFPGNFLVASP